MSEDEPSDESGETGTDVTGPAARPDGTSEDDLFEEMDVGSPAGSPGTFDGEGPPRPRETENGVVVPKRTYCERCRYFSEPPAVACTHEGTEILELVDMEHLRVVDCPVVAFRERNEGFTGRSGSTGGDGAGD